MDAKTSVHIASREREREEKEKGRQVGGSVLLSIDRSYIEDCVDVCLLLAACAVRDGDVVQARVVLERRHGARRELGLAHPAADLPASHFAHGLREARGALEGRRGWGSAHENLRFLVQVAAAPCGTSVNGSVLHCVVGRGCEKVRPRCGEGEAPSPPPLPPPPPLSFEGKSREGVRKRAAAKWRGGTRRVPAVAFLLAQRIKINNKGPQIGGPLHHCSPSSVAQAETAPVCATRGHTRARCRRCTMTHLKRRRCASDARMRSAPHHPSLCSSPRTARGGGWAFGCLRESASCARTEGPCSTFEISIEARQTER